LSCFHSRRRSVLGFDLKSEEIGMVTPWAEGPPG
jgi:hypothetical protein